MEIPFQAVVDLPFGKMGIRYSNHCLTALEFVPRAMAEAKPDDEFGNEIARQLIAWCENPEFAFSLAYELHGTSFQQRVWQAIAAIPLGATRSYAEIARELQTSPRAVGNACGRNPVPIIVPCHRVVSRTGLGGFNQSKTDWLLDTKRWLLAHEGLYFMR